MDSTDPRAGDVEDASTFSMLDVPAFDDDDDDGAGAEVDVDGATACAHDVAETANLRLDDALLAA